MIFSINLTFQVVVPKLIEKPSMSSSLSPAEQEFLEKSKVVKRALLLPELPDSLQQKISPIITKAISRLKKEARAPEGLEKEGKWAHIETRNGIKIYRKSVENHPVKCVKGVTEIEGFTSIKIST